jgi:hypothetical protein
MRLPEKQMQRLESLEEALRSDPPRSTDAS